MQEDSTRRGCYNAGLQRGNTLTLYRKTALEQKSPKHTIDSTNTEMSEYGAHFLNITVVEQTLEGILDILDNPKFQSSNKSVKTQ